MTDHTQSKSNASGNYDLRLEGAPLWRVTLHAYTRAWEPQQAEDLVHNVHFNIGTPVVDGSAIECDENGSPTRLDTTTPPPPVSLIAALRDYVNG